MMVTPYDTFVNMYYALDAYGGFISDRLREFVSEANPFIWADKGSADPAVYIEFERAWNEKFGDGQVDAPATWQFVREYLHAQDEGEYAFADACGVTLVAAFESVADKNA